MRFQAMTMVVVSLLLSTGALAASSDWNDLKGCYTTVSYNGQPGSPKLEDLGFSDSREDFGFATMPGVDRIAVFQSTLFHYQQGDTAHYGAVWIFPDHGVTQISTDGKTRTWSFSGPMTCTGLCSSPVDFTMNTRVEIQDLGNDVYRIHNFRQIQELPDHSMDADDTYILKRERTHCYL